MPIEVKMPRLSDTMEAGTVAKWTVKVGQKVRTGDAVADIETDKAVQELQSFDDGTVAAITVPEGQSVPVGTVIMLIAAPGEDPASISAPDAKPSSGASAPAPAKPQPASPAASSPQPQSAANAPAAPRSSPASSTPSTPPPSNGSPSTERIFASPLAKKIAAESNVNLADLTGSGPSGRIIRRDVEAAIASPATAPTSGARASAPSAPALPRLGSRLESKTVPLSNMRATIARRLVQSKTTIPHYQVTVSARMDALLSLREQLNDQLAAQGVKLSVNDFLVRACALAMHEHPHINASWVDAGPAIQLHADVNIGVAIALPIEQGGGLVVATLRNADQLGLRQISDQTRALATKARAKGLSVEEMSASTFTISNLGMFGVDHFTAIINPPNAAILAVGRAIEKPFIEPDDNGEPALVLGHEMAMTMSSDHRVIDGAMAAHYLETVKNYLEHPATLLV